MGCCGDREKGRLKNDVKWEYVNLDDFKSTSCWTPFAYIYLWIMLFISVSVYAVDTFTAINLLVFNKWAGQKQPAIKFEYSRWIFAGCIIVSFILLAYRWLRALKVMKEGTVARSYLDPLAIRVQSIRMGSNGRGWKRFLVFAELTKSRKGADYVALFAYYSFEAWLRICFAEGPRQVINAITLYSVLTGDLLPAGDHAATDGHSPFVQFWVNIGILADKNTLLVVVLLGMLWTLIIWVISAISLAVSVILYLIFLWHHIPSDAGGLTKYCRNKINRRMERIVKTKTDKALKKENEIRAREEARAFREGFSDPKRQPTLPDVGMDTKPTSSLPPLSRQTTMTTLPEYTSRPGTARLSDDKLPPMPVPGEGYRPGPSRQMTNASDVSWSSYNSNQPLMHSAGDMGYSPADSIQTPSSGVQTPWSARPGPPNRGFTGMSEFSDRPGPPNRSFTGMSEFSDRSYTPGPPRPPTAQDRSFTPGPPRPPTAQDRSFTPGPHRPPTAQSGRHTPGSYQMEPLSRPGTSTSNGPRNMRISADSDTLPAPTSRHQTPVSASSAHAPLFPDSQGRRTPAAAQGSYFPPVSPIPEYQGRESPALRSITPGAPVRPYSPAGLPPSRAMTPGMHPPPLPRVQTSSSVYSGDYVPFNPNRDNTPSPAPTSGSEGYRSFSRPMMSPPLGGGRQTPQAGSGLAPPRPSMPSREDSVDDIVNRY